MADSAIIVDSGTGPSVDTRTIAGGDHRQVVVLGDPVTDTAVAPVTAADGLLVNLGTNNDVIVADGGGSITVDAPVGTPVRVDPTGTTIQPVSGTISVSGSVTTVDSTTKTDDAAFTPAVDKVLPLGMFVDEAATDTLDEGDVGAARIDASRRVLTRIVGATDANRADVDASGHLQCDIAASSATVTVSATNLDIRDIDAATDDITVHGDVGILDQLDLTNSNPAAVAIVDGNGDQIVSFGGGTQYTEDAVAAADPIGTVQILVRTDTPATQTTTDGDNIAQRGTNYGAAFVTLVDSSGNYVSPGAGTQYTEDAVAAANPVGTALNLVREDARAGGLTTTDGDNVAARGTNAGELYVKHVDSIPVTDNAGSLTIDNATLSVVGGGVEATALRVTVASDSTGVLTVDNAGTFAVQESGGALTALQLIDNTIAVLGTATYTEAATSGSIIGAVRRDADTSAVNTDNEIAPLIVDANGYLKVEIFDGGGSHTVDGTVTANQGGAPWQVQSNSVNIATETTLDSLLTSSQLIDDAVATLGTTTYAEATTKGLFAAAVRRDADTSAVNTDNEAAPLLVNALGALKVEVFSGETLPVSGTVTANQGGSPWQVQSNSANIATETTLGSLLTSSQLIDDTIYVDDTATHTAATTKVLGVGLVAAPTDTALNANDIGMPGMSVGREQWSVIRDAAGNLRGANVDGNNNLGVVLAAETTKVIGAVRNFGNAGATLDSTVGAGSAPTNQVVTGGLYNTTAPAPTNGQAMAVQLDQAGNSRVLNGIALLTLSGWTSATGVNATQDIYTLSGTEAVLLHLVQTSTITGGAITFEVSYDNTNWVTIPADSVLDPASVTLARIPLPYTLVASTNKPFLLKSKGWRSLRIKLSTAITGTATVTPNYALLNFMPAATGVVVGSCADDDTTPCQPVMVGGQSKNFDGTAPGNVSAEDDVVIATFDRNRRLYVNTTHAEMWSFHSDGSAALTDTSVAGAPGANEALFVTDIIISTGAATACNFFFEEGASKVLGPYYLEALAGRGASMHFTTPKKITTNTALTITTSAAIAQAIDVTGFVARVD